MQIYRKLKPIPIMVDYSDTMDIVKAIIIISLIVVIVLFVLGENTKDRIRNDITPSEQPDIRTYDGNVQYRLEGQRIFYDVTAYVDLASEISADYLFVLRLRDIDIVAGCLTAGGTVEFPCHIEGDEQFYPFELVAQFNGRYNEIPPIVNLSAYSSTTAIAPEDGLVKFGLEGQTFIVGNYSVYVTERDHYEIGPLNFRKQYRVSVSCPGDSKIYSMDPEDYTVDKPLVINICEGEVKISIPERTGPDELLQHKIRIDTYRGKKWEGEGEKIGVFVWRYENGFYCGDFTGPGQAFNTEDALRDDECINKLMASRILVGDISQGYPLTPPIEFLE